MAAWTDKGHTRRINQDGILLQQASEGGWECVLAAVCDGLGGLQKGELASAEVIRGLAGWFRTEWPRLREQAGGEAEILKSWDRLLVEKNQQLVNYGIQNGLQLGTTVSAMLLADGCYYILHVGDCRIYEITGTGIRQLTRDQSWAAEAAEKGILTAEQARRDPRRSVLLQCVGVAESVRPVYLRGKMEREALYLVCSDGFWHEAGEQELYERCRPERLTGERAMREACRSIIRENRRRGETDNCSVVMVRTGNWAALC